MPRRAKELSPLAVSRLSRPGLHAVGVPAGLYLQVSKTGARSWIFRTMIGNRRRDMGLGAYPDTPLTRAREKARELREAIEQGRDPVEERRVAKARLKTKQATTITFEQAARKCIAAKLPEFKNAKHRAQWPSTIETYANPVFGSLPVDEVDLSHIIAALEPIWLTKSETAARLRGRIEAVLDWAKVRGFRQGDNPARWRGHLDAILAKPSRIKVVRHHRALPFDDVLEFMSALKKRQGTAARALELLVLTATRSGEIRGMSWDEIDITKRLWTIPAGRMKAGEEHRVPLSDAVMVLLADLPRFAGTVLVFPNTQGDRLSDMTLTAVLRRMKVDAVPHGFRSTFRDWCAERTSYPQHVAEKALAHKIADQVEAAYRRGDLLEKRRRLMSDWAAYCMSPKTTGDVVPLRTTSA